MLPIIISSIENPEDRDLMTNFYLKNNALMYREARKYLSIEEDIEDIVYEALTRIIEKIDTFRKLMPKQQVQYSIITVKNLSLILLKRSTRFSIVSIDSIDFDAFPDDTVSTESIVERNLFQSQIRQIWNELDLEVRMLLEQKYILEWTDNELAAVYEIQPQSVRMRLTRAKRSVLKELYKKNFNLSDW